MSRSHETILASLLHMNMPQEKTLNLYWNLMLVDPLVAGGILLLVLERVDAVHQLTPLRLRTPSRLLCLGLHRILIWPDIRPPDIRRLFLPKYQKRPDIRPAGYPVPTTLIMSYQLDIQLA